MTKTVKPPKLHLGKPKIAVHQRRKPRKKKIVYKRLPKGWTI